MTNRTNILAIIHKSPYITTDEIIDELGAEGPARAKAMTAINDAYKDGLLDRGKDDVTGKPSYIATAKGRAHLLARAEPVAKPAPQVAKPAPVAEPPAPATAAAPPSVTATPVALGYIVLPGGERYETHDAAMARAKDVVMAEGEVEVCAVLAKAQAQINWQHA